MAAARLVTVDVRDMLCAQALAVVAEAAKQLAADAALEIQHNAADVRRDLLIWARERGYEIREGAGAIWLTGRIPQSGHAP